MWKFISIMNDYVKIVSKLSDVENNWPTGYNENRIIHVFVILYFGNWIIDTIPIVQICAVSLHDYDSNRMKLAQVCQPTASKNQFRPVNI